MLVREDRAWDYALGMIKVDGLEPSQEMKELIEREKRGEITMEGIRAELGKRYKSGKYAQKTEISWKITRNGAQILQNAENTRSFPLSRVDFI